MARQIIKLGETVKAAWSKVNANFAELYNAVANIPTKTSQLTNDSGFLTQHQSLDAYAKKTDITAVYKYKGSKTSVAELPTTGNTVGDVWDVADGMNYAWNGSAWDALGTSVDLSGYATTAAMNSALDDKVDKVNGKQLSTNDYTTAEKNKLAGLSAPSKIAFTASNFGSADSDGYYTYTISSTRTPVRVMKKNGTTYEEVLVQVNDTDSSIVLISEEAFEGYVLTV